MAKEGYPYLFVTTLLALGSLNIHWAVCLFFLLCAAAVAFFLRDPKRY